MFSQKKWGHSSSLGSHRLISELFRTWSTHQVEEDYQNYYLRYLDTVPVDQVEEELTKEIKNTIEHKNHYFVIQSALKRHNRLLIIIKHRLKELQNRSTLHEEELKHICEHIDQLIDSNIELIEAVLMLKYYCLRFQRQQELIEAYNPLLHQIDQNMQLIKQSALRQYISFANSYDPFLLHHYETRKHESQKDEPEAIQKLFTMPITKAFRMIRLKNEAIEFMCGSVPKSSRFKRNGYKIVDKIVDENKTIEFKNENYESRKRFFSEDVQEDPTLGEIMRSKTDVVDLKVHIKNPLLGYKDLKSKNKIDELESPVMRKRMHTEGDQEPKQTILKTYEKMQNMTSEVFSERSSPTSRQKKHLFKIKRPHPILQLPKHTQSETQSIEKDKDFINYISLIEQRDSNFRKEIARPHPIQRTYSLNEELPSPQKPSPPQKPSNHKHIQEEPLVIKPPSRLQMTEQKEVSIQVEPPPQPLFPTSINFKIKGYSIEVSKVLIFIAELPIQRYYRMTFEVNNWEGSVLNYQYYLHKFYIGETLQAIALCCPLPEGNILIKYWGPTEPCTPELSKNLFGKYLEYIEKHVPFKDINYHAFDIPELIPNGFLRQTERIHRRPRQVECGVDHHGYRPFLTLKFSNLAVHYSTPKEKFENLIVNSNTAEPFTNESFICFNYLLIVNKLNNIGLMSSMGSYHQRLSLKSIETQLIKSELNHQSYNYELENILPVNLLVLNIHNVLHKACFLAKRPFFKLLGDLVYKDKESIIVSLEMVKPPKFNNKFSTKIYFAKNFPSLTSLVSLLKSNHQSKPSPFPFILRMFSKRMRGRINSINLREEYCVGDFEVVMEWVDFLGGRVEHEIGGAEVFGNGGFYCVVEVDGEKVVGFWVGENNFM